MIAIFKNTFRIQSTEWLLGSLAFSFTPCLQGCSHLCHQPRERGAHLWSVFTGTHLGWKPARFQELEERSQTFHATRHFPAQENPSDQGGHHGLYTTAAEQRQAIALRVRSKQFKNSLIPQLGFFSFLFYFHPARQDMMDQINRLKSSPRREQSENGCFLMCCLTWSRSRHLSDGQWSSGWLCSHTLASKFIQQRFWLKAFAAIWARAFRSPKRRR